MRILGIDYGDKRIGVAMSDISGMLASGLDTIKWDGNWEVPVRIITEIVRNNEVKKIVIGFPKNMDGSIGYRGEVTKKFVDKLKEELLEVEVILWDERLTTVIASKIMIDTGVKRSKKKGLVDKISAVCILQNYLDSISNK